MEDQQRRLAEELLSSSGKLEGFAKKLYFGVYEGRLITPYPIPTKEKQNETDEFIAKVHQFSQDQIDPDWIDKHGEIPASVTTGLIKLGVMGMTIPKELGGLGMSQRGYCKVAETIAGRCASTALFVSVHQSIGLKAILLFGTEKQKATWLGPLARGEKIAAFSLTEPNAGSDASGVETRAVYDPVKKVYRITGRKQWTTNGSIAHILTVMAKTEIDTPKGKQDKITAFLVTSDMPGFKVVVPALEKVGMRGTRTANLEFQNMEVPEENVLGPLGGGLRVCLTVLDYGRTTFGAMCTGAAKFLLDKAVTHAKTRHQFNRPLASFGLVKEKIAKMAALVYAMDAATYLTAGLIDAHVEDIMLESAILKVFTSEALWAIIYDTMQIYGGRSLFTEYPFERMMRDARLNMIGEGSNDVLRVFIAAVGMRDVGLEMKDFLEAFRRPLKNLKTISATFPSLIERLFKPKIDIHSSELKKEVQLLSSTIRRFSFSIGKLLAYYREGVVERQLELQRIAESSMALFTISAVLSKLDAVLQGRIHADNVQNDLKAGKLYCRMAFATIDTNLRALFCSQDETIETLADCITGVKKT